MPQAIYTVTDLPEGGVEASTAFVREHLAKARTHIGTGETESLAIVLPVAEDSHRDWRLALARDLARAHAPARVNVVAGVDGDALTGILGYLESAKGVTGHYLQLNE